MGSGMGTMPPYLTGVGNGWSGASGSTNIGGPIAGGRPDPRVIAGSNAGGPNMTTHTPMQQPGGLAPLSGPNATQLAGAGAQNQYDTLTGKYLDPSSNPWLQKTFNQAATDVTNQYNLGTAPSLMAQSIGAGGGGAGALAGSSGFQQMQGLNQYNLGQNLNNLATDIYGGNYQQERQNQMGAAGMLGNTENAMYLPANEMMGVGALQQGQQQNIFDTMFGNASLKANWPMQQLGALGSILGQAVGNSGTTINPNMAATK